MIPLTERSPSTRVNSDNELRQREINLRVAAPGIIQSFNSAEQTVTVQLSIREKRNNDGVETWEDLPQLVDVPVVFPRAGGYVLTMPIKPGDECLVILAIIAWTPGGSPVVFRIKLTAGDTIFLTVTVSRDHGRSRGLFRITVLHRRSFVQRAVLLTLNLPEMILISWQRGISRLRGQG